MSNLIYSKLMKAEFLYFRSQVFPILVRAACAYERVPYTPEVLEFCSTQAPILDALEVSDEAALDEALQAFARDEEVAVIMDTLIINAVQAFRATIEGEANGND